MSELSTLSRVMALQEAMLSAGAVYGAANEACPVRHHFAPGIYAREMFIKAGYTVVGKMHRHAHFALVLRGRIAIANDTGADEVCAPAFFVSQPLTKRAGHALEDTVWITFHPTDKTDPTEIEADVIVPETEVLEMLKREAIQ